MIPRALEAEIVRLHHVEHGPIGTRARPLRVHHSTVCRALAQAGVPALQPTVRASLIEPYRAFINQTLTADPTLRASRLYHRVRERGYPGAPEGTWLTADPSLTHGRQAGLTPGAMSLAPGV